MYETVSLADSIFAVDAISAVDLAFAVDVFLVTASEDDSSCRYCKQKMVSQLPLKATANCMRFSAFASSASEIGFKFWRYAKRCKKRAVKLKIAARRHCCRPSFAAAA